MVMDRKSLAQPHLRKKDSATGRKPLVSSSKTWASPEAMAVACFVAAERRKRKETPTGKPAPISSVNKFTFCNLHFGWSTCLSCCM